MFAPHIERWRRIAEVESHGVPPDLTLAFIARESDGRVGIVRAVDSPSGYTDDEIRATGFPAALRRRDAGLMQITPGTYRDYCRATGTPFQPTLLIEKSDRAAHAQIHAGTYVLARALFAALELSDLARADDAARKSQGAGGIWPAGQPSSEQIMISRCVNGWGRHGTKTRLDKAAQQFAGDPFPRSFNSLELYPFGPRRLLVNARRITDQFFAGGDPSYGPPVPGGRDPRPWNWSAEGARGAARSSSPLIPSPASSSSSSGSGSGLVLLGAGLILVYALSKRGGRELT